MAATEQHDEWDAIDDGQEPSRMRILLYSDDVRTRDAVILAVGRRVAKDLPPVEWLQVATPAAAVAAVEAGGLDLLVLDGETGKNGGLGLGRQLKDEIFGCPPALALTGRPQDAWLASWSQADAVVSRPLDPIALQKAVASLVRGGAVVG
ncbi:hypothetical protein [Actinotalea soli]|nr:hypothetical protein [Actinotalea soli]